MGEAKAKRTSIWLEQKTLYDAYYAYAGYRHPETFSLVRVHMHEFEKFIGMQLHWYSHRQKVTPRLYRRLKAMAGPHGYAFMKAMEAKRQKL